MGLDGLSSVVVLAAAVVPHPPLLVPALAAGAAPELASLLAACDTVLARLLATAARTVVCVGAGQRTVRHAAGEWGTLAGYGAAVAAPAEHADAPPSLPLSLIIGRWLLDRAGWSGAVVSQQVSAQASAEDCARLGGRLAAEVGPDAAWLVLGDGSNRRGPRSPGHDDPRAAGFDAARVRAFAHADLTALLEVDAGLAAELGVAGRVAWQVLAGAAGAEPKAGPAAEIEAEVLYDAAPFGVEYLVAGWSVRR